MFLAQSLFPEFILVKRLKIEGRAIIKNNINFLGKQPRSRIPCLFLDQFLTLCIDIIKCPIYSIQVKFYAEVSFQIHEALAFACRIGNSGHDQMFDGLGCLYPPCRVTDYPIKTKFIKQLAINLVDADHHTIFFTKLFQVYPQRLIWRQVSLFSSFDSHSSQFIRTE